MWRFAFALVALTRLASADGGSAGSGATAPQPVEHHAIGIVFVLVSAVGLLILSKVLPRATRSEKPKDPP